MLERLRPRFVEVRRLANGSLGFYFRIPTYYRKLGCEIANEPLGINYEAACGQEGKGGRAATLNALFDEWNGQRRGEAIDQAISLIKRETAEGEPVAVMPEGTSLNFFTGRPNPLREEITTPGYLDRAGEERAIRQLVESNTRVVLVTNRATSEFGPREFGRDYCQTLMQWIEQNFEECAILGPNQDPNQQIGDKTFFIRAYRKRSV